MILDEIVAHKRTEITNLAKIPRPDNCERDFNAVFNGEHIGIIAEIKPRSPSAGVIKANVDPTAIAKQYEQGGAHAISVLTDEKYFGGSYANLAAVRAATTLPLLCKEFIIDPIQIYHARAAGADACLLIAAVLNDVEIAELKTIIESLGMSALIEVQNQAELDRVLKLDAKIIGINNRDLTNFTVDKTNAATLAKNIPAHIKVISASGINEPVEIAQLPMRIDGVLIGTALLRSANPTEFLKDCNKTGSRQ